MSTRFLLISLFKNYVFFYYESCFLIYIIPYFCRIFAGFTPRVLWITLGGAFFFGFYDLTLRLLGANATSDKVNA